MPLLVSVIFFVIFYIFTLLGKQLVRQGDFNIILGMWMADIVLFPFGILFLIQAKNDSRLFEFDFKQLFKFKKSTPVPAAPSSIALGKDQ